ncbi:hypothetical protein AVEN_52309-1 [Araneus ventricosus]|uniref:Uncharacterized protein n=1 Tax=Araneus ventricosus TaxID=182803 RepID=A0A4Y2GMI0_ARAVE|nr:hypothetical protein AVEN_52309-1 [Araneus ventricosus]
MGRRFNKIEEVPFLEDENDENGSFSEYSLSFLRNFIGRTQTDRLAFLFLLMIAYFFFVVLVYLDGEYYSHDNQTDHILPFDCIDLFYNQR